MPDGIPAFGQYIGIDYSGAAAPISSLKGLRIYIATRELPPVEVLPPPSPRKYWTRRGIAEWLVELFDKVNRNWDSDFLARNSKVFYPDRKANISILYGSI